MSHGKSLDYPTWAKRGFLIGISFLVLGVLGSTVGPSVAGPLPGWEQTVLLDMMAGGILVGFFSVFGFGILLPLIE